MLSYISYHYRRHTGRPKVTEFVEYNKGRLVGEYVEGQGKWPRLVEAIEKCKEAGATLIIVEIGRLARNPRFLGLLLESGIDFVCLDNEHCNRHTVHILLATAEEESEKISRRTRKSMAECRKRGIKLGSARPGHWKGREHLRGTKQAIAASVKMRRVRTRQAYEYLLPDLKRMRLEGKTMDEIAAWLNARDCLTTVGTPFNQVSVWRLLKRYLGDDFLGPVKDRGGRPQRIRAMEKSA
jgi:DNA invertase Pin-like site-specific DNA recombinase